jgi:L-threonylcarbamoyladenylate synthase
LKNLPVYVKLSDVKTILTTSPQEAAEFINRGGIAAFPTETVYGLGASVFDERAIAKIFEAKQRPADNPLIAHVGEIEQIALLTAAVNRPARRFIDAFFPGPLTLVLPKSDKVPLIATAGLDTIGVRMPGSVLAQEFLKACGAPVVAPSANLSGKPSPTTWQAVREDLNGRIDCILQGDETEIGLESTVVDCSRDVPVILRTGGVTLEQLRAVEPETEEYADRPSEVPRSPGMKHKHYSPKARVILCGNAHGSGRVLSDMSRAAYIGLAAPLNGFELAKICDSVENYAHSVFEFFRECDRQGIETIYCEEIEEKGVGVALMDRLRRAAE